MGSGSGRVVFVCVVVASKVMRKRAHILISFICTYIDAYLYIVSTAIDGCATILIGYMAAFYNVCAFVRPCLAIRTHLRDDDIYIKF